MIRYSDPSQSMQLMQGMMDYDPANAALMMNEVSKEGFDIFSHMNNAENISENMIYSGGDANFEDVRAALVSGMMLDTSEEAIDTMARVMAVSDPSMRSYLVNEITNFEGKKLMIVSFLEGKAKQNLSPNNCKAIGIETAKMHELTKNFKLKKKNVCTD